MNKTTLYLTCLTSFARSTLEKIGLKQSYLGTIENESNWGKTLVLEFDLHKVADVHATFEISRLSQLNNQWASFEMKEVLASTFLMHFTLTDECVDTIITPFMAGQYSKLNKDFKDMHFSKTYIPSKVNDLGRIHSVIWKRPHYKKLLTDSLGIEYTKIEELDSIPLFQDEILGYKENRLVEEMSPSIKDNEAFIVLCNTLDWDTKETGINEILENTYQISIGL